MLHVVVINIVHEQSVVLDFRSACVETENQGFHLPKPGSIISSIITYADTTMSLSIFYPLSKLTF